MGYDVTFHPIALADLQRLVFDVIDSPALLQERLGEMCHSEPQREHLTSMFGHVFRAMRADQKALGADDADEASPDEVEGEDEDEELSGPPGDLIPFLAACVAGHLHPYWYCRGGALSFATSLDVDRWIRPFHEIGQGRIRSLPDEIPVILENFDATGFWPPEALPEIASLIERRDPALLEGLGEAGCESLGRAIAYARERGLGLIEATDVAIPGGDIFAADPDNLRAQYLKNLDGPSAREALRRLRATRPAPGGTPPSVAVPRECGYCGKVNPPSAETCDCGRALGNAAGESGSGAFAERRRKRGFGIMMIVGALVIGAALLVAGQGVAGLLGALVLLIRGTMMVGEARE